LDCQLLAGSLGRHHVRVSGWAFTSGDVISGLAAHRPDVALISTGLQDGPYAGIAVALEIRTNQPELRMVLLLDSSSPDLVLSAFRSGAVGVFSRHQSSTELRKCIHSVLEGKPWVSHADIMCLIEAVRKIPAKGIINSNGVSMLTNREEEVVQLLLNGLTNREMADQLGLSEHTVKNYFFSIFEKVGVSTRVELLLYAMSHARSSNTPRREKPLKRA
jgi:DNA-binding NarL/FixJ family response regulator